MSVRVNRMMASLMPIMMFIMNCTTIAVIWFGAIRVDHGTSNVGNMMAFLQYAMQILFSLLMASMLFIMLPRAQASADRINEALDTKSSIRDPEKPRTFGDVGRQAVHGCVEFRNVTFRYHGAEAPALSDISFAACPGEVTAIIGSTGSGKSTLLSLIPRFYDVDSGAVLVDGIDVRELPLSDLRARIGYVPQKAVLFTGTVAENIRYGKVDASDDSVRVAAATAQATEFVDSMADGYASVIAQGGTNVSGGQKQRLSIARALVRRPEIYLFDDSFSALDFKTDAKLRAALARETQDATVLIVGQRVATIMDADRIIVLEEGKVAGMGTHRELYAGCPVYREIVASQLSEEEVG
jgi:ATP-binding cassette subfamily B protein